MKSIYIFGTGGLAKEAAMLIRNINKASDKYLLKGFVEIATPEQNTLLNVPIFSEEKTQDWYHEDSAYIIAIANSKTKESIYRKFPSLQYPNFVHPLSFVDEETIQMGQGNIVLMNCTLSTHVSMGNFNTLCYQTTIGHETIIGSFNSFYPQSCISGEVIIEDQCEFGANSTILQNLHIVKGSIIGASCLVTKSIHTKGTYIGVPHQRMGT
ncbi:MAG: acetyltransferase [Bdellovibrionota bacterium]